ncbi:MAG: D-glycero-beta-D-manno-heptose 1,7-bisphosphate 7-phosphatase [Sedimentisphaerales bacterium]|nr:D-glycero-beta-D-manno-heptose 1,7-bisphosphate 7-phosphatase [Sedimentisphaerales bacterium]
MSNKAIFLDRDDTLIEDPGYLSDPAQVKLLGGVPKALTALKSMGYKLVLVTNQSAVARGIITEKVLAKIHDRLEHLLAEENAGLDAIYYCPYHPEGSVPKFRKESNCRKPNPGMLLMAADELDIDLSESWMIGNAAHDVEAGLRAGCKTILIDLPSRQKQSGPNDPVPHYKAVNVVEAVNVIKKYLRRGDNATPIAQTEPAEEAEPASEPITQDPEPIVQQSEAEAVRQEVEPAEQEPQRAKGNSEPAIEEPEPTTETNRKTSTQIKPKRPTAPREDHTETTQELLAKILDQMKSTHRREMFDEFSIMRFAAGVVQGLVMLCLLITIYLLMKPGRQDTSVLIALGFATVLQLMSLTFYAMQDRK